MKISTLINREPFEDIFSRTLGTFLSEYYDKPFCVSWHTGPRKKLNGQIWLCNPQINSIFVHGVDRNVFKIVNGEYSKNPQKPWKSVFQLTYIYLSQSKILSKLFARHTILISPAIKDAHKLLILGGNTKIRIFDEANNRVFSILKIGFNKKYISNELSLRRNNKFLYSPRIFDIGIDGSWYCEDFISGIPADRLCGNNKGRVLIRASDNILKLIEQTSYSEVVQLYILKLVKQVNRLLCNTRLNRNVYDKTNKIINNIQEHLSLYSSSEISLASCHGDFHPGNIVASNEKLAIIDWEHCGVKQIFYDLFIMIMGARSVNNYCEQFKIMVKSLLNGKSALSDGWRKHLETEKPKMKLYFFLFLFEELVFYIEENNTPVLYANNSILSNKINQINEALSFIKTIYIDV